MKRHYLGVGIALLALGAASASVALGQRIHLAQAAPGEQAPQTPAPGGALAPMDAGSMAISRESEPLMLHILAAYYVTDESMLRDLHGRGWSFGDLATAGNLAARSRRSLQEVAAVYDTRHDWTAVARDLNVGPDDLYVAINGSRYTMVRAPLEGEIAAPSDATTKAAGVASPPAAAAPSDATTKAAAAGAPPAPTAPGAAPAPTERVAGARLEMLPQEPRTLLTHAVATYYALPHSTVRDLQAKGWSMSDVITAGNIHHRSDATFDEVVALRSANNDWNAVAEHVGVAADRISQPTTSRRVASVPDRPSEADREREEKERHEREVREWEWLRATHHGQTPGEDLFRNSNPNEWDDTGNAWNSHYNDYMRQLERDREREKREKKMKSEDHDRDHDRSKSNEEHTER